MTDFSCREALTSRTGYHQQSLVYVHHVQLDQSSTFNKPCEELHAKQSKANFTPSLDFTRVIRAEDLRLLKYQTKLKVRRVEE